MNVEKLVARWGLRIFFSVLSGIIDTGIYYIIFAVLLPSIVEALYYELGGEAPITAGDGYRSGLLVIGVASVFTAARILQGTPLSPVFRSAGVLLSLTLAVAALGGALTVSIEGLEVGNGLYLDFTLDLTPLYMAILFFIVFPGIVAFFIEYFLWEASR